MEIRLRAEYIATEQYGPRFPGRVSVQLSTIQDGFTEVLSIPTYVVPGYSKHAEEQAIAIALREFFSELGELAARSDALIGIADNG